MKEQTVIWTALPNGTGDGRLRLSVLVSPLLKTNEGLPRPTLTQFPDFLHWPSVAVQFQVQITGGPALPATITRVAPSADLWSALFNSSTYVRPHSFQGLNDWRVRSFPAKHVAGFLKSQYTRFAATAPTDHPHVEALGSRESFGAIATYLEREGNLTYVPVDADKALQHQLEESLNKSKAIPPSPTPNPLLDFYQAKLFHRPRTAAPVAMTPPELDFHQAVASLGDYPEIMRRVGLVIDLEIPADGVPPGGTLQVIPQWSPAMTTQNINPKTAFVAGSGVFTAAPRPAGADLVGGMLDLSDPDVVQVIPFDIDGAAIKAMDFANNLRRSQSVRYRTGDTPQHFSVPALRSMGLSVTRTGRAFKLVQHLQAQTQRNAAATGGSDVTLYAEDLVRGYRIDVWDSRSEVWHALCRRIGEYHFPNGDLNFRAEDEGCVSLGLSQSADGSDPDLYLHESLFRWSGWSLVAPRPGGMISPKDQVSGDASPEAGGDFKLQTRFTPTPGSLPRLRYGTTYRLRARAADLAGNGVPHDSPADATATAPTRYGRFDPVPSPAVILREAVTPGESLERLVIRSNFDAASIKANERHIASPKTAQLTAEEHGMFDTPTGLDRASYATITGKDGNFDPAGLQPEAQLTLPYLPDPIARGAALQGLPGAASTTLVDFGSDPWPGAKPFRLKIAEGTGAPAWNGVNRVLTVLLPKAEIAPVRLSSFLKPDDLGTLGMWHWLEEAGLPAATLASLKDHAIHGRLWMLTPFRDLTLVHAVQQPLTPPNFKALTSSRQLGKTFATIKDAMPISGKSTEKVDLLAQWQEPIDALADPKWKMVPGKAHAFAVPVSYGDTVANLNNPHDFGDTKYRKVTYSAVATSRFKEYFHVPAAEDLTLSAAPVPLAHAGVVSHSETVTNADGTAAYARDTDYTLDYATGQLARLATGAIADGQAIRVAYSCLPVDVTRSSEKPVEIEVLNAARPAAPKVLYIVPTFGWEKQEYETGVVINRTGGGLRIYMERPWFSSGDGELLGVVLWSGAANPQFTFVPSLLPPDNAKPYVTQWGMDPIWKSIPTRPIPLLEHFTRAVAGKTGLSIDELPGTGVAVAGHAVGYDETRRLWFCDIAIDAGESYYPFVRLALARYQPKSLPDAHLSRVVLAEYAQIAPDRQASITIDPDLPQQLRVSLCGPGYTHTAAGRGSSEVEVSVETRRSDVPGELGWIPVPDAVFPLPLLQVQHDELLWAGPVSLPEPRGAKPFRLVIKEFERLGGSVQPNLTFRSIAGGERRLVYASVLEL